MKETIDKPFLYMVKEHHRPVSETLYFEVNIYLFIFIINFTFSIDFKAYEKNFNLIQNFFVIHSI